MTMHTDNDKEVIHLPGFWSTMAKLTMAASIPAMLSVIGLLTWTVKTLFQHDTRIAVLEVLENRNGKTKAGASVKAASDVATNQGKP